MSQGVKKRSERIMTFDLLRGYFLIVILLNHLNYYPNGLRFLTGESFLYVSTAEGFFAVSGIVLGIIRGRKLIDKPFMVSARLLWKRAAQLYILSVLLTFFFTVIGQLFLQNEGLKYGIYTDWSQWGTFVVQTLTLTYSYGWADFLKYYALFLAVTPLALWLLRKGLWYLVLLLSLAVWGLFPLSPLSPELSQPLSWQLVFMGGFVVGFYWDDIVKRWRSLQLSTRRAIRTSIVVAFMTTATLSFLLVFGHELGGSIGAWVTAIHHSVEQYFDKDSLPLTRIALGTIWFWGLFAIVRRYETWLVQKLGWVLLAFGSNSLYVYTVSACVVFFIHLSVAPRSSENLASNLILSLFAIGIVLLAVRIKFLLKPTNRLHDIR